ncbi:MAG: hypothetical protein ACREDF_03375, partial [Thermoplasmata archaeon]
TLTVFVVYISPEEPAVMLNWKPLVAAVFAACLAALGARAAKRRPWKRAAKEDSALFAFVAVSLPFVLAEVATGVLSFFTGYLSIPPVIGLGSMVDGTILAVGVILALLWGRRGNRAPDDQGSRDLTVGK